MKPLQNAAFWTVASEKTTLCGNNSVYVLVLWLTTTIEGFQNWNFRSNMSSPTKSYYIFWFFGLFVFRRISCVIFFTLNFHLASLALQNVTKDYVIFSYFRNFVAKTDKERKTKH